MKHSILRILIILPTVLFSQKELKTGDVIKEYGKTYTIEHTDFKTDTIHDLKVVFDIAQSSKDHTKVNPLINTAARYLNMHVDAGVSIKNLKVALVIHGDASNDILNDINYTAKFGLKNPNTPLLSSLTEHGVQVILCGQTAAYRNITKPDVHPNVQFALSAMTALVQLQNENYKFINF